MKASKTIQKRQVNPNTDIDTVSIIEHTDFNIAADQQNVFHIKVPNPGNNPNTTVKAFRAFHNVFIVPERYLYNKYYDSLYQPMTPTSVGVYDPSYLFTADNKSDFLKKITLLLKRIAQTNTGQSLLRGLANGLPLKDFKGDYQQGAFDSCSTVEILKPNGKPAGDSIPCSLIIYGPSPNCIRHEAVWAINKKNPELINNGHGAMAEVIFCPDLLPGLFTSDPNCSNCIPFQKLFVPDPAVILFHEMLHALHINYGSLIDVIYPISNQYSPIYAEELVMVHPSDRAKIPNLTQDYDRKLKENLDRIVDSLNNVTVMSKEVKKLYQNKYYLEYDTTSNKYSWTKDGFNQLLGLVRYSIYEKKICKELGVLSRKSYLSHAHTKFYRANILDETTYTIDKGFNLRGGYSGQKTNNPKLIQEDRTVSITIDICSSRSTISKRSLTRPHLCTKIKSDKMIRIVNDDYSSYKIVHTIDDAPLMQQKTKTHKRHYFPKVNYPVNTLLSTNDIQIVPLITKGLSDTYLPINTNITVNKFSRYHVLNAQMYDKTLNPKQDKILFLNATGKDQTISQSLHDNKVFYSYFSKVNTTINKTQSFANYYLYAQWVRQLVADFKEESTTKRIQKIGEDVIQIVPYIGAAYNVGNDIAHGEFTKAFIDAGIGMLLIFFPQTVIPLAIYSITTNLLQSRSTRATKPGNKEKKIRNTLKNAIKMRQKYIESYTNAMLYMWWGHVYLQVEDMMYNLSQQMQNYKDSILHNITYHGLKVLETDKTATQQSIDRLKDNFEMYIDIHIQKAMQNTINMLTISAKKHLKEKWHKNIIDKLKAYDLQASKELRSFIHNNSQGIPYPTIHNWVASLVDHFNNPDGLEDILNNKKINKNIDQILYNLVLTPSELNKSKILCQIETQVDNNYENKEIIDVTGQTEITASENINEIRTPKGRQTNCLLFEKDFYIKLEKNELLSKTSLYEDFTWSFWIRHPVETNEKNTEMGYEESISIIRLIEEGKHPLGFQFILKYGYILFNINTLNDDNELKKQYLYGGAIADNKWHMITVTYDSKSQFIYIYKDTILEKKASISSLNKSMLNTDLIIGLSNNKNPQFFFKIEQFKAYNIFFTKEHILSSYNDDMGNYLYDHWGEPLKYNTMYYMNHIPLEGHKSVKHKTHKLGLEYIVKDTQKKEFKPSPHSKPYTSLYIGEKIAFYNLSGLYEKTAMLNRSIAKIKPVDGILESYIYNQDNYLIYENSTNYKRSNIFQLHALRQEIKRVSSKFNPYSIIITGTTYQEYNAGTFINYNWYNNEYYTIERGSFKTDKNALAKPGRNPFIQSMEDENDDYINRFCWTFVPEDQDNGWKES